MRYCQPDSRHSGSSQKRNPVPIDDLLDQLERAERDFVGKEFLAPVIPSHPVAVRIQGTICQITVPPEVESGWAILRSLSTGKGEFVRKATLLEVSRYLSLFPRVKLVLVEKEERKWLAFPAQSGDTRFRVKGPVAVFLPEEALERFESIEARFDGRLFWYEGRDTSRDPAIAAYFRGELLRQESDGLPPKPDDLHKPGLSREEREAYAWVLSRIAQARRSRVETHLAEAVAHAGAELHSFVERGDAYVVTYEVDGQQFTSTVRRNDFTILTAGICLSGQDELFDLTSLVGVLREGRSGLAP